MNRRSKVAGALALGVMLLGGGIAGALWAASGSGSGEANAVTAQVVTVSAATGAADLYPGFTGGDVFFTVTNPNPYSVLFSSMAVGTVTSSDPVGCPSSSVSVASATGLNAGRRGQRHVGHAIDRRCGHDGRRCAGCVPGRDLHDRVDALRFSGLTVAMLARAVGVGLLASAVFVACPPRQAGAEFLATGTGSALAAAQSIPESVPPVAIVSGREVALSWSATTLTGGTPAESYTVRRYDTSNVAQVVLTGCDVVTTTSCVENNVPVGAWTYSVQARMGSWVGAEGPPSATITVATSSLVLDSTAPISPLPATVTGAIANFLVAETLTYRLDSPAGPVLVGTPAVVTSSASTAVSVTVPAGTSSAPHSIFVVGSGGSFAAAAIDIAVPPRLQSMQMRDVNGNGKVDQVTVVFDDTLAAYSAGIVPWTLTNVPSAGSLSSVVVNGTTATLTITEGAGAANTAVGTFRVALAANAAGIRDLNGPQSSFAATAPTDVAAPARVSSTMQDVSLNGRVDRLTVTFSEPLAAYTAPTTIWTLANVPSGGALASVTVVTPTVTIAITEGAGPLDTSVGSFTVALAADPAGIRDATGNLASLATTTPTDGARPIRQSAEMFDDNADGKIDRVVTTFSESLAPFTAPASVFVLSAAPSGATLNTVNVSANQATLALNQGAAAANTAVGSFRISLASNIAGIRDATGNLSSHAPPHPPTAPHPSSSRSPCSTTTATARSIASQRCSARRCRPTRRARRRGRSPTCPRAGR